MSEASTVGLRRFYTNAGVEETRGGARLVLDGKPVRTPAKGELIVPTRPLAEAIAAEWNAQGEKIDPTTMPLTRLANTIVDGLIGREEAIADDIESYGANDLLCYRAGEPEGLVILQRAKWDPVLAWAKETLGARFVLAEGVMPVEQPYDTRTAVRAALKPYDAFALAALHVMTTLTGSALLALAVARGGLTADEAWDAAHVDEDFQIGLWSTDHEAKERRAYRRGEYGAAVRMLELLTQEGSAVGLD